MSRVYAMGPTGKGWVPLRGSVHAVSPAKHWLFRSSTESGPGSQGLVLLGAPALQLGSCVTLWLTCTETVFLSSCPALRGGPDLTCHICHPGFLLQWAVMHLISVGLSTQGI